MHKSGKRKAVSRKISGWTRNHREIVKFCLLFLLYIGLFLGLFILATIYEKRSVDSLNVFTAKTIQMAASLLGMEAWASSRHLTVNGFSIKVVIECTGLFAAFVFLACILAYPATLKKKCFGVSGGIVVIYLLNVIRMLFLIFVGLWAPRFFDFAHHYLWEAVFIIVILMLWLAWLDKVVKDVRKVEVSV